MIKANVMLKAAEIRGVEKRTSKKGNSYLIVRVDDEAGNRSELLDRDIDREAFYERGQLMDITLSLNVGKYTSVEIINATTKK